MMIVRRAPRAVALAMVLLALAACAERRDPAPIVFRGTQPGTAAPRGAVAPVGPVILPTQPVAGAPDANGVIDYGGYRAIVARQGDTVESVAARAGMSASALAAYNGLPTGHVPRAGDELILPPEAGGANTAVAAAPSAAPSVAAAPLAPPPGTAAVTPPTPAPAQAAPVVAAAPSAPAAAPATAPGFDLQRIEQSLGQGQTATRTTPPATTPPAAPASAPTPPPTTTVTRPAPAAPMTAPPAAPAATAAAPAETPSRTAAAPATAPAAAPAPAPSRSARFVKPVSGEISRPFNRSGSGRSDGVDFAAPAGSEVKAAAPGQVALVSEALGGNLGTVVLIRHADQMLTVYGRVNSKVEQGQRVQAGQVIGTVAPAPGGGGDSLHFEVRRGTEPVDPAPFFGG
jgi:murein DD-endopeptidase MepM/ murein hydrolase activator NlpD